MERHLRPREARCLGQTGRRTPLGASTSQLVPARRTSMLVPTRRTCAKITRPLSNARSVATVPDRICWTPQAMSFSGSALTQTRGRVSCTAVGPRLVTGVPTRPTATGTAVVLLALAPAAAITTEPGVTVVPSDLQNTRAASRIRANRTRVTAMAAAQIQRYQTKHISAPVTLDSQESPAKAVIVDSSATLLLATLLLHYSLKQGSGSVPVVSES